MPLWNPPLAPRLLRTLHVSPAKHPRGQAHLSAASGLVCIDKQAVVVADDEHHWGRFSVLPEQFSQAVELLRCLPGDLPMDAKQRKRSKPDFESLTVLPAFRGYPQGALLALGSGSTSQRHLGLLTSLNDTGELPLAELTFNSVDLRAWYAPLHAEFSDLNIEGCLVQADQMHLVQRGNKGDSPSACISYRLIDVLSWLGQKRPHPVTLRSNRWTSGTSKAFPSRPPKPSRCPMAAGS